MKRAMIVGLALAATAYGCHRPEPGGSAPAGSASGAPAEIRIDPALVTGARVKVGVAERRALGSEVRLAGEIVPTERGEAEVGALVSGRVASLLVAEGDHVQKGQVLAWVDAPEVGRATADVLRARARAAIADRKLARQLDLEKQQATSLNAIDEARAEVKTARADLVAARTLLANLGGSEPAETEQGSTAAVGVRVAIRSPLDGVVAQRMAVLGGSVAPDKALFRVVAASQVVVRAKFPETAGALPAPSSPAVLRPRTRGVEVDRPACDAVVASTLGVVDEASRTIALRVEPKGPCPWLVPGGYVDVIVARARSATGEPPREAVVVPREAVVDIRGAATVFVAGAAEGQFTPRPVTTGASDGDAIVIEAGLAPGERIATAGVVLLKGELLRAEISN